MKRLGLLILSYSLAFALFVGIFGCTNQIDESSDPPFFYMYDFSFFGKRVAVINGDFGFNFPLTYPEPIVSESKVRISKPTAWGGYFYSYPDFHIKVSNISFDLWEEINLVSDEWIEREISPFSFGKVDGYLFQSFSVKTKKRISNEIVFLCNGDVVEIEIGYNANDASHIEIVTDFLDSFVLFKK